MDVGHIIEEREKTHGPYREKAQWAQNMKKAMRCPDGWDNLLPYQRESLDMIASKIARALYGDPTEIDHWRDIAGYAQLVVRELEEAYGRVR